MKKIFALLVLGLFSLQAHAGIITYDVITSDAGISYTYFNNAYSKIYNEFNGNISTLNILNDTLTEPDFADAINPRVRDFELIGNYTYTGHLPATSATLASDISAGTSYVNGYRLVTAATNHTYTASKDTWVYIDQNGAFQYQEVALGAVQPSDPANSLLLAKVVTSGAAITAVTDYRTTTPVNLRIYQDLKSGLVISRDTATATTVTVGNGEIEFGSDAGKVRRNLNTKNVDFTTTGSGGLDTGTLSAGTFYYIFAYQDSSNSANYSVIASTSSTDATGVTGERLVGWCYANSASAISPDSVGAYRGKGGDAPNMAVSFLSSDIAISSPTAASYLDGAIVRFVTSGRPVSLSLNGWATKAAGTSTVLDIRFNIDGVDMANSERSFFFYDGQPGVFSVNDVVNIGEGEHTLRLKIHNNGGTVTIKNRKIIIQEQ